LNEMFSGIKIVLGVTGGIAAYKAAELVRRLVRSGSQVRVIMTEAATRFVSPLTFETLSGNRVLLDLFSEQGGGTAHIEWARWPDAILVCPATANTVARVATGMADNALTTTLLASKAPVIFCPAMNAEMYASPLYQDNEKRLKTLGYLFVAPGQGELACGEEGWGRLAELDDILDALEKRLIVHQDLEGVNVLVTAGPTREPLDPVRFLSNRSSGRMGFAVAERAHRRGAQVTLVTGPSELEPASGVNCIRISSAAEMAEAVSAKHPECDILIMSAAVSDVRPRQAAATKIKKQSLPQRLELEKTPDILALAGAHKENRVHVGFALETENGAASAKKKCREKNCDFIVLNNPLQQGAGFDVETNKVTLVDAHGRCDDIPLLSKREVADILLDKALKLLRDSRAAD